MNSNFLGLRPFQLIFIVVFVVCALVGLLLFASYSGFGGTSDTAVGSVRVWGTLPAGAMDGALRILKENKDYAGIAYTEIPAASFDARLADALAAGEGPDLVLLTQESLLAQQNKILPIPFTSISNRTYVSSYLPIGELLLTDEGTYGIPFLVDPIVLYYNRSIFTAAGITKTPPSWETVSALTQNLTVRRDDQSLVRSAIALGEYENITNARAIVSLFLLQAGLPIAEKVFDDMRAALGSGVTGSTVSPGVAAINYYTQFSNPVKTVYSWNRSLPSSRDAFLGGDLALYLGFASEQPFLAAANPNLEFDMARVPQPGTSQKVVTYGNLYWFAIPKASKNTSGAFRAALALGEDAPLGSVAKALSVAPAKRAALVPDADDLYAPIYYPAALTAAAWLSPMPNETDAVFSTLVANITTGRFDAGAALNAAENALTAAYK